MSKRFDGSNCGIMPITKTTIAAMASAVIANITLRASPTPNRNSPTKIP
jgi:hypothetical protein